VAGSNRQHDAEAGGDGRIRAEPPHVDPAVGQGVADESAVQIVADRGRERGRHSEAGQPAGHDGGRAAQHEIGGVDQGLRLPERGNGIAGEEQVGVGVADDQDVGHEHAGSSLCSTPSMSDARMLIVRRTKLSVMLTRS
jgi:hypothetical protein